MKILVFGGAGFIGTNICLEAINRGHQVTAFDNFVRVDTEDNARLLQSKGVTVIRGDIRVPADFDKLLQVPDRIIHLAAQPGIPPSIESPLYDFSINTLGTLNILEYSRLHGKIPVIFASSNKVYTNMINDAPMQELKSRLEWNFQDPMPELLQGTLTFKGANERMPLDTFSKYPRSPYGASKVSADLYCQEYHHCFGVPVVINRMSCVYGLYQKGVESQAWVSWFLRKLTTGDRKINIFGNGKQVRDMVFGTDIANLYLDEAENLEKVQGNVYNIGGGFDKTMSLIECIRYIEELTGNNAKITYHPKRHADQDIWVSDTTKIENDLGWKSRVAPKAGIKLMYETNL